MTRLTLVAGFLGAGKTTLMKRLIAHHQGGKLRVIVNEFGRHGMDGTLLRELGAAVSEINDGSIFCACRVKEFEDALKTAVLEGADRVLVESSGFSDPVSIRGIIQSIPGLAYQGCVTLAGADSVLKVSQTSRIASRQLGIADLILLNRCDRVSEEQKAEALRFLKERYPLTRILPTVQAEIDPGLLDALAPTDAPTEAPHARDLSLRKLSLTISPDTDPRSLEGILRLVAEESLRVKGILRLHDGPYLVDCVGPAVSLLPHAGKPEDAGSALTVLASASAGLDGALDAARRLYGHFLLEVTE